MYKIYLDHAATTQPAPEVVEQMLPWMSGKYGNPSAGYSLGREAKAALEKAREEVAGLIGAKAEEICFTSGGTEADNWILRRGVPGNKRHVITDSIEHHAMLNTCAWLEKQGMHVSYIKPDGMGRVDPRRVEAEITEDTGLLSFMFANNEIGTVQPVRELGRLAAEYGIPFHTDAVQAVGHVPVDVRDMGITYLSASAHKFSGPKGIGFLYMKEGNALQPLLYGGGQEQGIRAGTENVAAIVGMGAAARLCQRRMQEELKQVRRVRNYFIRQVRKQIPDAVLNGHPLYRLPGNVNFSFPGIKGETLLLLMDREGICVSAGAACTTAGQGISHVLSAIGLPEDLARGTLRFTLGADNTMEEMNQVAASLKRNIEMLRKMS